MNTIVTKKIIRKGGKAKKRITPRRKKNNRVQVKNKNTAANNKKRVMTARLNMNKSIFGTRYRDALMFPESATQAKIPTIYKEGTVSLRRHLTISSITNSIGNACIIWQPFQFEEGSGNISTFLINNATGYDTRSVIGVGATYTATPFQVAAGTASQFRLVSASMHIVGQTSKLNISGSIYGANQIMKGITPGLPGALFTDSSYQILPIIEADTINTYANMTAGESLRLLFVPADVDDTQFFAVDGSAPVSGREDTLIAIITGYSNTTVTPAVGLPFNVELYLNFEIIPLQSSVLCGMETFSRENVEEVARTIGFMRQNPANIVMPYKCTERAFQAPKQQGGQYANQGINAINELDLREGHNRTMNHLNDHDRLYSMSLGDDNGFLDQSLYWQNMMASEKGVEYHIPFHNYIGPGTHIIDRINRRVMPTNKTDLAAMLHDIDYFRYAGDKPKLYDADETAISNFSYDPVGMLGKIGLTVRKELDLPFTNTDKRDRFMGEHLRRQVLTHKPYTDMMKREGIIWK